MKVLIARLNHETNTFSPVATPLESFGPNGPALGSDAYDENVEARTAMAAFIHAAQQVGAEIVTPLSAMAFPSGKVDQAAFEAMCDHILQDMPGCGALMLDLHGAMVTEAYDDGEGELLRRIRAQAPDVPIAMALDLHANVTETMVSSVDILVGFKTYPHVDMYETGEHAAKLLLKQLSGEINPVMTWRQLPLMSHTLESGTAEGAMHDAVQAALAAEKDDVLAVSVFAGFALSDIPAPCVSVVTVTDGDKDIAKKVTNTIGQLIWERRSGFIYDSPALSDSITQAARSAAEQKNNTDSGAVKPVLLLDHSDNCMSGGTCDTMDVLQECLNQGLSGIAAGPVCDPEAVAKLFDAGVGASVTLPVGNKVALTQLQITKTPLVLTGRVRALTDGEFVVTGPTYTGHTWRMGRTAVLETPHVTLVIVETPQEPLDLGVFTSVGIDPARQRFLLLKSRMYCRPVFEPLCSAVIECDAAGVTSSNYDLFPFSRLNRPVYPFDRDMSLSQD